MANFMAGSLDEKPGVEFLNSKHFQKLGKILGVQNNMQVDLQAYNDDGFSYLKSLLVREHVQQVN